MKTTKILSVKRNRDRRRAAQKGVGLIEASFTLLVFFLMVVGIFNIYAVFSLRSDVQNYMAAALYFVASKDRISVEDILEVTEFGDNMVAAHPFADRNASQSFARLSLVVPDPNNPNGAVVRWNAVRNLVYWNPAGSSAGQRTPYVDAGVTFSAQEAFAGNEALVVVDLVLSAKTVLLPSFQLKFLDSLAPFHLGTSQEIAICDETGTSGVLSIGRPPPACSSLGTI